MSRADYKDDSNIAEDIAEEVVDAAATASTHFETLGRAGWVAKGVVYFLIGALFVNIATGPENQEANQVGAVEAVAETAFGNILLMLLGLGLLLYAIWRALTVVLPGDWTGRALLDRLGFAFSAVVYSALLFTVVGFLRNTADGAEQREDRTIETLVKNVLDVTAGRTMVIIAGLVCIVIGIVFVKKGASRSFRSQISGGDGIEGTLIDQLGTIGWIARGISMAAIGYFLIRAAWRFDSDEAAGLDDSMRQLANSTWGAVLVFTVGAGFIAFGMFAALSARHRVLEGPRNQ